MKRSGLLPLFIIVVLVVTVFVAYAQSGPVQPLQAVMPNTPIDGGIFLLLAVGLVYGGKVLYRKD